LELRARDAVKSILSSAWGASRLGLTLIKVIAGLSHKRVARLTKDCRRDLNSRGFGQEGKYQLERYLTASIRGFIGLGTTPGLPVFFKELRIMHSLRL
jgi:hypothetical protein